MDSPAVHSHEFNPGFIAELKYRAAVKRIAIEDSGGPANVIRLATCDMKDDAKFAQQHLSYGAQRKIIHRVRKRVAGSPREPESITELQVPEHLRKDLTGKCFLIGDVKVGDHRALIFGTEEGLRRLDSAKYWVIDGTFRTAPTLFRQLMTIMASCGPDHQSAYPAIFTLMTSKTELLYRSVFAKIIEAAEAIDLDLSPSVILSDFEKAIINASKLEFPESKHNCCFFHFSKNLLDHIRSEKMSHLFDQNQHNFNIYKKVQALAFLPSEEIPEAFATLKKEAPENLHEFFAYVEEFYVLGKVTRVNKKKKVFRSDPLFPPALWSVYDSVKQRVPRTTNQIEAFHRRWNSLVGLNPGVFKVIEELRKEELQTSVFVESHLASTNKKRKTGHEDADEQFFKDVERYETYKVPDYLTAIAANLGSKWQKH